MEVRPQLRIHQAPEVYPPSEDSFLLLSALEVEPGERFLEVGTGSGLIALHAVANGARVVASDVDPLALRLVSRNARANGMGLALVRADLLGPFRGPFDVVVFNPPYLPRGEDETPEPRWTGGQAGGEALGRFLQDLPRVLDAKGRAYVVISSLTGGDWRGGLDPWAIEVVGRTSMAFEQLRVLLLRTRAP